MKFCTIPIAALVASMPVSAQVPVENVPTVVVKADRKEVIITVEGQTATPWILMEPDKDDPLDLSAITPPEGGTLCVVTNVDKGCLQLKKGQAGRFNIEFEGNSYPALLKV
ncbi:hypothetical protein [Sphingomonas colocasiae]|uniref:Uncharacterized protein n=1 Tax=Sphingomonas colocasiae TaxID=1848973 RepID=A0ABS7PPT2_9SPHN|nr:hypothetical protein [Sphingomonas colocasiae]MBY8823233.1 hypothetical protein [Sphingomonas colocasiae]